MNILPSQDRELLAGLRICRPLERDQTSSRNRMVSRPRVLVPQRLLPWFVGMTEHGGLVHEINIRDEVCVVAQEKIGALYDRKADPEKGPDRYSCSSFSKTVFACVGIWLPRYAIDQSYVGTMTGIRRAPIGSLLFYRNRYPITDPNRSVGHVGIKVDEHHMIHGSSRKRTIAKERIPANQGHGMDVIPSGDSLLLLLPERMTGVETALDVVRWLQR